MALTASDLGPKVGSEVKTDKRALLSGAHRAQLRELLVERGVLLVRFDPDSGRRLHRFSVNGEESTSAAA
jgi:hypothetical protein